ncbi:MAG: nucleoside phosphorylase [Candidatus Paceibacterota bacterium]|jgi:uridine phosphorylase
MKKKPGPKSSSDKAGEVRKASAAKPSHGDQEYHLRTRPGEIARYVVEVGDPGRAEMIANTLFDKTSEPRYFGDHRGLKCYTGFSTIGGGLGVMPISVVTTHMGGPNTGIVTPEAVRCGARIIIRVGSCGGLWPQVEVGDSAICTGAVRLDGASSDWAPIEYPAIADYRVVSALVNAAEALKLPYHVGIGATTGCFNEGQARPEFFTDEKGYIPPRLQQRHDELLKRGVLFYSMEEASLFTWCSGHGGFLAGAVDAIFCNRTKPDSKFEAKGEENAARIAIRALQILFTYFGVDGDPFSHHRPAFPSFEKWK